MNHYDCIFLESCLEKPPDFSKYSLTTCEPGASEVLTLASTFNPSSTAFFATKPAATRIDGFEVLSHMKKDPDLASIPVIILSNLGQRDDVQKGIDLGAEDYLIKAHFTPGEIVEKIKVTLEPKKGKDQ